MIYRRKCRSANSIHHLSFAFGWLHNARAAQIDFGPDVSGGKEFSKANAPSRRSAGEVVKRLIRALQMSHSMEQFQTFVYSSRLQFARLPGFGQFK